MPGGELAGQGAAAADQGALVSAEGGARPLDPGGDEDAGLSRLPKLRLELRLDA